MKTNMFMFYSFLYRILFLPLFHSDVFSNSAPLQEFCFIWYFIFIFFSGFLAAHLIGQHPDIYKVACMRNPVTDIPGMLTVTDIPG